MIGGADKRLIAVRAVGMNATGWQLADKATGVALRTVHRVVIMASADGATEAKLYHVVDGRRYTERVFVDFIQQGEPIGGS